MDDSIGSASIKLAVCDPCKAVLEEEVNLHLPAPEDRLGGLFATALAKVWTLLCAECRSAFRLGLPDGATVDGQPLVFGPSVSWRPIQRKGEGPVRNLRIEAPDGGRYAVTGTGTAGSPFRLRREPPEPGLPDGRPRPNRAERRRQQFGHRAGGR